MHEKLASESNQNNAESIRVISPPRLKRDYVGKRIRALKPLRNGFFIVPAGALGVIDHQSPKGSSIIFDTCPCCGIAAIMTGIHPAMFEFIETCDH